MQIYPAADATGRGRRRRRREGGREGGKEGAGGVGGIVLLIINCDSNGKEEINAWKSTNVRKLCWVSVRVLRLRVCVR